MLLVPAAVELREHYYSGATEGKEKSNSDVGSSQVRRRESDGSGRRSTEGAISHERSGSCTAILFRRLKSGTRKACVHRRSNAPVCAETHRFQDRGSGALSCPGRCVVLGL